MEKSAPAIFLVHTDLDGVCSAAIAKRIYNGNVRIYFAGPRTLVSALKKIRFCKTLGIVDVALNHSDAPLVVKELERLKSSSCEIIWIDHHEWLPEDIETVSKLVNLILERSPSAASILYRKFAYTDEVSKKIAEIADDGDSNKNELEYTLAYKIGTRNNADRNKLIEMFYKGEFYNQEVERWKKQLEEENRIIEELIKKAKSYFSASGYRISFVDVRGFTIIGSLLAKKLQQLGSNIVFILYSNTSGVLYGDGKVNLLEIATKYNGGGHPNACGVNFKLSLFDKLFIRLYKKKLPGMAKKLLADLKFL